MKRCLDKAMRYIAHDYKNLVQMNLDLNFEFSFKPEHKNKT